MNRFYQGDWIDSMASRFIDELPEKYLEKNSYFDEEVTEVEDFDFNQDFENEDEMIQPLLDEIAQLREQLLLTNQQLIEVQTESIENAAN